MCDVYLYYNSQYLEEKKLFSFSVFLGHFNAKSNLYKKYRNLKIKKTYFSLHPSSSIN